MEVKDLYPIIISFVLVGMLIGIGVLTFDKFGLAAYTDTPANTSITWTKGSNATLRGNITSFGTVTNGSDTVTASNYTAYNTDGKLYMAGNNSACEDGDTCYATYTWRNYGTKTNEAMGSAATALGGLASTWMGLIITIIVLAIILGVVISSFQRRG